MKNNQQNETRKFNYLENQIKSYSLNRRIGTLKQEKTPEILMITTFPPRECGIATYSQDLMKSIKDKFGKSFDLKICALENGNNSYNGDVAYVLETSKPNSYLKLAQDININNQIQLVVVQHEFGLFRDNEDNFLQFLNAVERSFVVVFHTVLPKPNELMQQTVQEIAEIADGIIVMTNCSKTLLEEDYLIPKEKINIIPHGTHLVEHTDKETLKRKYNLEGRKVLSTFGLLGSGKDIETSLKALPAIIESHPEVVFLIIGKTHPTIIKYEGEKYRESLELLIEMLQIQGNVRFVNSYLALTELLEYLQLTDIYLFTSKDPNQAVSGTFSYAISCGCPIISTPIPHAREVLKNGTGVIIDFENPKQLSEHAIHLLHNNKVRSEMRMNGLHQMAPSAWENSAIKHAKVFENLMGSNVELDYKLPEINLNHFKKLTTHFGILQFSVLNQPDPNSGYTLDDNARALIAMCQCYKLNPTKGNLDYLTIYYNFIDYCLSTPNQFYNYVNIENEFTSQNEVTNLEDSYGRAIWALGYLISESTILPFQLGYRAKELLKKTLEFTTEIHSTRAMSFIIKGVYYSNLHQKSNKNKAIITQFANRLVNMYRHEADNKWKWYESYLTYANSIIPEAMLLAWLATNKDSYKIAAKKSFDFLLSKTFTSDAIKVISNKGWMHNGVEQINTVSGGEQPIDVAYTVIALSEFYDAFRNDEYKQKMNLAFNWFLGKNHLNQIVYNPATGGCYDGLEDHYVNLNQGAESTISYLLARLTLEKYKTVKENVPLKPFELKIKSPKNNSLNYLSI
jgi:glycosyltransferase involved in cell wall biosynthesis